VPPIAEQHRRPLDPAEYAALVERTRALVQEHTAPGAAVAVVSRGDEALLALDGRRGWHFPRAASGAYAGHHPPDSAAAVAHLEELRASGADYLAVPASARWWLDHYDDFARHLEARCRLLVEDDACSLFALAAPAPAAPAEAVDPATRERLERFLDALLPERCRVLVAGPGWEALALAPRTVVPVPAAGGGMADALGEIERQRRAGGPAYAVVPLADGRADWLARLEAELARRQPPLARRDRLALVFDLQTPTTTQETSLA
jgi:hypothetical protein